MKTPEELFAECFCNEMEKNLKAYIERMKALGFKEPEKEKGPEGPDSE